jgi:putative transposase
MVKYRRVFIEEGTYFFTITLKNRQSDFLTRYVENFKTAYRGVKKTRPFKTLAYVILPEHCHLIWKLPEDDFDYAGRWREIKKGFTKALLGKGINFQKNNHNEYDLWQRRYWEQTIRDEKDLENHINYIHFNSLKHGYVQNVKDWKHSSFHTYVSKGILTQDWMGTNEEIAT